LFLSFQEEYVQEGIKWTEIEYFNNAIVCQLIEEKRPKPGIMAVMDDVCASLHGVKDGADDNLKSKLRENCGQNKYFDDTAFGFAIHHYAGVVQYNVEGFCDRNKDVFNTDLVELMKSSESAFIRALFPEEVDRSSKKRPITSGAKIKQQVCSQLINVYLTVHDVLLIFRRMNL
jgi:myosin-1